MKKIILKGEDKERMLKVLASKAEPNKKLSEAIKSIKENKSKE